VNADIQQETDMTSVHLPATGKCLTNSLLKTPAAPPTDKSTVQEAVKSIPVNDITTHEIQLPQRVLEIPPGIWELTATMEVPEETLMALMSELGDQDRSNFLSALAKSGDSARKFFIATDRLNGKEREAFLTFADQLSEEGIQDFLTAINNSPKDLKSIMETGSNLSDKNLDNYLSAAAMAGKDVDILNEEVNDHLDKSGKPTGKDLSGFLSAAAKSDTFVIKLIEKTHGVSEKTGDKILDFINTQAPGEELDNFHLMMENASAAAINTIIDISPELTDQERKELLKTTSRLGKDLDLFTDTISTLAIDHSGDNPTGLSDFIITAGKAGKQVGKLLDLSRQIDLGITSKLSAVDTANFLVAADKADGQLPLLTELTEALAGNDRSNLLYGIAYTDVDPEKFLSQVKNMDEDVRSNFLLSAANQGQEEVEHGIFMKGILSPKAYENFKTAADSMEKDQIEELVAITNALDETDRNNFLKMASTAGDTTNKLLNVVTAVSGTERKEFLDVGRYLVKDNLKNFIKAGETATIGAAQGGFSDFVGLTRELGGYELNYYLEASAQAPPNVLDDLTDFTKELTTKRLVAEDNKQLKTLNPKIYSNGIERLKSKRFNFLEAASKAGSDLEGLIHMGRVMNAKGNGSLGSMIQTYA
jgi:hypothetical protein